jgi:ribosomal-protein-alanine N-acetyltransferase
MAHSIAPRIRLAVNDDAHDIGQLSRHAIEHGLAWSWTPRRVHHCLRDAATNVVVAREQGALAGFGIMKYGDDDAHLLLLAVAPALRRRGVGTGLLNWLERTARVAGLRAIRLELRTANDVARTFYRHHGFTETGQMSGYYQGLEDATRMLKPLRTAPATPSNPATPPR